jgi:hypothetical protein
MKDAIANDTDLQQQLTAQQEQPGQALQGPQGQPQQPMPYNPENPVIETVFPAINNIMELRKARL